MSWKRYDESSFPHNLKVVREQRGWTQQDLSAESGIPVTQISNFECGERAPSLKNLIKLCLALKCSPDDLLTP